MSADPATSSFPFHVMVKPAGPLCNLDCRYCFYLAKTRLYPGERLAMDEAVLESFIRQYIQAQPPVCEEIPFAWQGGEPTLLGLDFFRRVVDIQERCRPAGRRITNSIQTNAILLDDAWAQFLAERAFLVGISIDGPRHLHDRYRRDRQGRGSFDRVMAAIDCCKRRGVAFNTLTVVSRANSKEPLEVYRFLREIGSGFLQFIPLVERAEDGEGTEHALAGPPQSRPENLPVTSWSVRGQDFGAFLIAIFDEWIRGDVGRVFVQLFDVWLGAWHEGRASLCSFAPTCGQALALEHNGDLYACDHYVYPEYCLGNILSEPLAALVAKPRQQAFGAAKRERLTAQCRRCPWLFACGGDCLKHRVATSEDGEPGLSWFCAGYRRFFAHADPFLRRMSSLLHQRQSPALIMDELRRTRSGRRPGRNEPCPCGSGRKFKQCCGRG